MDKISHIENSVKKANEKPVLKVTSYVEYIINLMKEKKKTEEKIL